MVKRSSNGSPPPKRGETAIPAWAVMTAVQFQSTPPAEARGDGTICPRSEQGNGVSIHSPRRSEGRQRVLRADGGVQLGVSIHSPRRSEGRPGSRDQPRPRRPCFNPLPPPKRGETNWCLSEGPACWTFQSTPPAEARGDMAGGRRRGAHRSSFNPLPPPKRGETDMLVWHAPSLVMFQSTPPAEARGDRTFILPPVLSSKFQSTPPAEARGDGP